MFWPHFESQFVPSYFFLQKCILTEDFFSHLLKSDPSFFFSLHVFQLLANHFLLSESNVCVVAQWCDLLDLNPQRIQSLLLQFWIETN